jgi:hypothetical protein
MKRTLWLSIILSLAITAAAAPFGELFPVTNTRYRSVGGGARLVANDRDFFLFWTAAGKVRAARVDDGEARVSHVALDSGEGFDVAWTGEHYVIVSTRRATLFPYASAVIGRVLDSEAHPVGAEFTIAIPDGQQPRIAVGEHSIAMVYAIAASQETRLVLLSRNGRTIETPSRVIAPRGTSHAVTRHGDGFMAIIGIKGGIRAARLDRQGQTAAESTFAAEPQDQPRYVAVASNGATMLAIWCEHGKTVAITVDENAGFGAPIELDRLSGFTYSPSVVWNGARWVVSHHHSQSSPSLNKAVFTQLDWRGQTILTREETADQNVIPSIAALDGRVLAAWLANGANKNLVVAELPLARQKRLKTPWLASQQTLLATASSADATLTVWSEIVGGGVSIHTGLRSLQGQWSERQLTTMLDPSIQLKALAASDGNGFAVVLSSPSMSVIHLVDPSGRPSGALSLPVPWADVMAWNGTNYGVINREGDGVLVSPSGVVSAKVSTNTDFEPVALASDGHGFFLTGYTMGCFADITCVPTPDEIRGARLGPDLKRLDPEDFRVPHHDAPEVVGAAWDGSRYFLIGNNPGTGSYLSYIPPSPPYLLETKPLNNFMDSVAMTLLRDGTIAIANRARTVTHMSFVNGEGTILHTSNVDGIIDAPRLEPLAGGGVALLASSVLNAAPHDGTSRIVMAIARPSDVLPPGAPRVGVRVQNGVIRVDWSAPSGTVNGYRLEYRVDDDEWVEWEQWFGPGEQNKSIRQPSFGTHFAFRVRAFNDGGAGPYSTPASTKPSRRRAVR